MNMAEMAVDIQMDENTKEDCRLIIQELAGLCDMPSYEVRVEETHNEDGSVDVHIETVESKPKPTLTVIHNDKHDNDNKTE